MLLQCYCYVFCQSFHFFVIWRFLVAAFGWDHRWSLDVIFLKSILILFPLSRSLEVSLPFGRLSKQFLLIRHACHMSISSFLICRPLYNLMGVSKPLWNFLRPPGTEFLASRSQYFLSEFVPSFMFAFRKLNHNSFLYLTGTFIHISIRKTPKVIMSVSVCVCVGVCGGWNKY